MSKFNQNFITLIIDRYGLASDEYRIESTVVAWLKQYDSTWIVKAIIESVHRGRYKIVSVDSILNSWQRLGKTVCKFTPEFERDFFERLPAIIDTPEAPTVSVPAQEFIAIHPILLNSEDLNPEESAPFQHHKHSFLVTHPSAIQSGGDNLRHLINSRSQLSEIIQDQDLANRCGELDRNEMISQPKHQLFWTLKSIVDRNNHNITEPLLDDNYGCPTVDFPPVPDFQFPLNQASGE